MSTNSNNKNNVTVSNGWISVPFPPPMYTYTIGAGGGASTTEVPTKPVPKSYKDGCTCKKCKEVYPYAEPNQPDETLICYACRMEW